MNLTATPLRSLANSLRLHYDSKNRSQIFQHVENFSVVGEAVATPLRMSATDSEVDATVLRLQIVQFAMESQSNSQKCKRGLKLLLQSCQLPLASVAWLAAAQRHLKAFYLFDLQ